MTSARLVAYDALKRIDADGAYANLVVGAMLARSDLPDIDRAFVTDLVYGTTRMRRACDALVDRFITKPPDAATRTLLRLGAYQLEFAGSTSA
jgi:16S rRNA (cytosine967-C5)-methyltransferase